MNGDRSFCVPALADIQTPGSEPSAEGSPLLLLLLLL